jgi:hypothetical protein
MNRALVEMTELAFENAIRARDVSPFPPALREGGTPRKIGVPDTLNPSPPGGGEPSARVAKRVAS